jgi:hypothetical protein
MGSLLRGLNAHASKQDYLVLPEQPWLDGISTSPGIVKQFVATEMVPPRKPKKTGTYGKGKTRMVEDCTDEEDEAIAPIGASIERQITGEDAVGGVQLHIIPAFDVKRMSACSRKNVCQRHEGSHIMLATVVDYLPEGATAYDVMETPEDQGLPVGDFIHLKDLKNLRESRPKTVADIFHESPVLLTPRDVIELEFQYQEAKRWTFKVYRPGQTRPSATLLVRYANFPRHPRCLPRLTTHSSFPRTTISMISWRLFETSSGACRAAYQPGAPQKILLR